MSLLGREPYERRQPPGQETAAQCNRCGSRDAQDFRRDGHYPRYLDTGWGRLKVRVPQLECVCKGSVKVPFQTLQSRQRVWYTTGQGPGHPARGEMSTSPPAVCPEGGQRRGAPYDNVLADNRYATTSVVTSRFDSVCRRGVCGDPTRDEG
jgi:hypothetical protein